MFWFVAKIFGRGERQGPHLPTNRVLGANDETRLVFDTIVGNDRSSLRQLQHGKAVVALTDAKRDGFAREPLLLLGFFEVAALPGLVGQHAANLAMNVDTGDLAKAKRLHEVVHGFHAHLIGQ